GRARRGARHARAAERRDALFPLPSFGRNGGVHGRVAAPGRAASLRPEPGRARRALAPRGRASGPGVRGDLSDVSLHEEVLAANRALPENGLVTLTWGNVSGIDRAAEEVVIKPSGVSYDALGVSDLVVVTLDGTVVSGERWPSSDTPTHLALYRAFPSIGAIVHTHSTWATAWAQAGAEIPLLGTTHADLCAHPIPVTRQLTAEEVERDYEGSTGEVLIETISRFGAEELPCALVRGHAPFCWGETPAQAVANAVTLEAVAKMALLTTALEPSAGPLPDHVRDKHYQRKHGPQAYYGQS